MGDGGNNCDTGWLEVPWCNIREERNRLMRCEGSESVGTWRVVIISCWVKARGSPDSVGLVLPRGSLYASRWEGLMGNKVKKISGRMSTIIAISILE